MAWWGTMSAPRTAIPVIVLSGGLGSGKTTLLNHLLARGRGRIGVIVNDFGAINIDVLLVQGHADATASITGGCLCCLADPSELDTTLGALARPEADLDVIVIEASGLAEPRELARMVLSTEVRGVRFGGVIEVLDAGAWVAADGGEMPVAPDHLAVASLLVVNKADLLEDSPEAAARLDAALAEHAPSTPVVRTTFGRVDPGLVFDAEARGPASGQLSFTDLLVEQAHQHEHAREHGSHDGHEHTRWTSVSVESPRAAHPSRLVAFLESRPRGVYRVKGHTWVGAGEERRSFVVQAVGGWLAFEERPWSESEAGTRLVAIGTDTHETALRAAIENCLTSEDLPADLTHTITRYLR